MCRPVTILVLLVLRGRPRGAVLLGARARGDAPPIMRACAVCQAAACDGDGLLLADAVGPPRPSTRSRCDAVTLAPSQHRAGRAIRPGMRTCVRAGITSSRRRWCRDRGAETCPTLRQVVLDCPGSGLMSSIASCSALRYRPETSCPPQERRTPAARTGWCSGMSRQTPGGLPAGGPCPRAHLARGLSGLHLDLTVPTVRGPVRPL